MQALHQTRHLRAHRRLYGNPGPEEHSRIAREEGRSARSRGDSRSSISSLPKAKLSFATAPVECLHRPEVLPLTATRASSAQNAVSQQDTDNAILAAAPAPTPRSASAQANVDRLVQLQSFERITAPFDGVITARNLDIGQLITTTGSTTTPGAGTVDGSKEVFDIAAVNTLRVFVNVPQIYAPDAKNGVIATLTLPQCPNRVQLRGRLERSDRTPIDPTGRCTLLAEVDVDNRSGDLLPGSYTEVHLNVSGHRARMESIGSARSSSSPTASSSPRSMHRATRTSSASRPAAITAPPWRCSAA